MAVQLKVLEELASGIDGHLSQQAQAQAEGQRGFKDRFDALTALTARIEGRLSQEARAQAESQRAAKDRLDALTALTEGIDSRLSQQAGTQAGSQRALQERFDGLKGLTERMARSGESRLDHVASLLEGTVVPEIDAASKALSVRLGEVSAHISGEIGDLGGTSLSQRLDGLAGQIDGASALIMARLKSARAFEWLVSPRSECGSRH